MEANRRDFIKSAGRSAMLLGMSPLLGGCSGANRSDLRPEHQPEAETAALDAGMAQILYFASLAPSGHNMQPWRVRRIEPYVYAIGMDKSRRLPAVDPDDRETLLSIGAFVENLCCAASSLGFETQVEVTGTGAADEDIVKVALAKARPSDFPIGRLSARRTVKKGYLPQSLSKEHAKALAAVWPGHVFHFDRNSNHARCLADWTAESFRHQTLRDDTQRELANCIRFSREDALKYRDGLTTGSMEITGIAGWYVRSFLNAQSVMDASFRNRGIDLYSAQAREGAGWTIIMSAGNCVADLVETGRRFERMALMVRELGIAIHPMTQILEEQRWRDQFTSIHPSTMKPQFILRVGYLRWYPDPVSLRRPVKWFIET